MMLRCTSKSLGLLLLAFGNDLTCAALKTNVTDSLQSVREGNDNATFIDGLDGYYTDYHNCPLPCTDFANIHSWTPYISTGRLERCKEPMLLQFSVDHPLDDPATTVLIRACSLRSSGASIKRVLSTSVKNSKTAGYTAVSSLHVTPACKSDGIRVQNQLQMLQSGSNVANSSGVLELLGGMHKFFNTTNNCDESFIFAQLNGLVASMYVGNNLGKATAQSTLRSLTEQVRQNTSVSARTIVQTCNDRREPQRIVGIAIDTAAGLAAVQRTARNWSEGSCASTDGMIETLHKGQVWEISADLQANHTLNRTYHFNQTLRRNSLGCSDPVNSTLTRRQTSGTCATHLIRNGDTCWALGEQYGVSVDDIEAFNKGKTWGWQGCADLLLGYNMCIGEGAPPMPVPQEGTQCGTLVPGTEPPSDPAISLADLNPCPLNACCSNWGFCGVFPDHCTINAPPGAAPGAKNKDAQNTCVSNCGTDIQGNSGPPASFGRIGYYSAFAYNRECLHLAAKDANTDGSYTIIHWAFAEIDPSTWDVVLTDPGEQWEDFKALRDVKRIVSFGGWDYSTHPDTYNIIRQAILTNYEIFASKVAQFVQDHGLDGVDIDYEYPGAPDILVDGRPIGQKDDGRQYLRFLRVLRSRLGSDKSLSIAAPASFWYLKSFPIDSMAEVLDYIVFMTYDLHGQWDHGSPNAYDNCDSGKCIRSHVNLTETRNALGMVTEAGVPTNKIFEGESSYGRSFHMAKPDCWGPMCEFTGSRTESDANPGRCTKTRGYLANAEIAELLMLGTGTEQFHDDASNTDVLLHKGDYISYMTTTTKDTRRLDWKALNFAGSVDWALDLQGFSSSDGDPPSTLPQEGDDSCTRGRNLTLYSGDLCEFSCSLGFCPSSFCQCTDEVPASSRPSPVKAPDVRAVDESSIVLTQLCRFACQYRYCPSEVCVQGEGPGTIEDDEGVKQPYRGSLAECVSFKDSRYRDVSVDQCYNFCRPALIETEEEGKTTNYGCMAITVDGKIPWVEMKGTSYGQAAAGRCLCDNFLINEIVDTVVDALPVIAQICLLLPYRRSVYVYPESEDPAGAFDWWLSPCGGDHLLPEEVRKAFDIMSLLGEGATSFRRPRNVRQGSGKKGDDGNPNDRSTPRKPDDDQDGKNSRIKRCRTPGTMYPAKRLYENIGANVVYRSTCGDDKRWTTNYYTANSVMYPAHGRETVSVGTCQGGVTAAACRHYSSAISVRPAYQSVTCAQAQATAGPDPVYRPHVRRWYAEHAGAGWRDAAHREYKKKCQVDEYPPAYLLGPEAIARDQAQLVRYIPDNANNAGGKIFPGWCMRGGLAGLDDEEFVKRVKAGRYSEVQRKNGGMTTRLTAMINVEVVPVFSMGVWQHETLPNDGLDDNTCWPSGIAAGDPGFALLQNDPYNIARMGQRPNYDYRQPYVAGQNGV